MSSIRSITASNHMPADLAKKLGKNGVVEILSVLWDGYHSLKKANVITPEMDENEITEEWFLHVDEIWHHENRALRLSIKIAPSLQHEDKTKAQPVGQPPTIDFCFRSWENRDSYFGIECKNLYEANSKYIKRYVQTGIDNYINGRYGAQSSVSSIAGFILSGEVSSVVSELRNEIATISPLKNLTKDLSTPDALYQSKHTRKSDNVCITIHHLFFDFANVM